LDRWTWDGQDPNIGSGNDYNIYRKPELTDEMMMLNNRKLKEACQNDVGVSLMKLRLAQ
jgi:hypothetical protein